MGTQIMIRRTPSAAGRTLRAATIVAGLLATLTLGACSSGGHSTVVYDDYDPWRYDYRYRTGIYGHHHDDIDVNVNYPDRPRPAHVARSGGGRRTGGGGGRRGGGRR